MARQSCEDSHEESRQSHEIFCSDKAEDNHAKWLSESFLKGFQKPNCNPSLLYNQQQKSKNKTVVIYNTCIEMMQNTEL